MFYGECAGRSFMRSVPFCLSLPVVDHQAPQSGADAPRSAASSEAHVRLHTAVQAIQRSQHHRLKPIAHSTYIV